MTSLDVLKPKTGELFMNRCASRKHGSVAAERSLSSSAQSPRGTCSRQEDTVGSSLHCAPAQLQEPTQQAWACHHTSRRQKADMLSLDGYLRTIFM